LQRSGVTYVPLAEPYVFEQNIIWREPFSSTCIERFIELVKSLPLHSAPLSRRHFM
jgi:hypothetical protein